MPLGRCLDHLRKCSDFDETLQKKKRSSFFEMGRKMCWSVALGPYLSRVSLSRPVAGFVRRQQRSRISSQPWGRLCGTAYLSELGCIGFKITNRFLSQFEEVYVALWPAHLALFSRSRLHSTDGFLVGLRTSWSCYSCLLALAKIFKAVFLSHFCL